MSYRWNHTHVPPLAMSDDVPAGERPSLTWLAKVGAVSARIAFNRLLNGQSTPDLSAAEAAEGPTASPSVLGAAGAPTLPRFEGLEIPVLAEDATERLQQVDDLVESARARAEASAGGVGLAAAVASLESGALDLADEAIHALEGVGGAEEVRLLQLARTLRDQGLEDPHKLVDRLARGSREAEADPSDAQFRSAFATASAVPTDGRTLEDYKRLFRVLPLPRDVDLDSDASFADLFVAGFNPLMIAACDASAGGVPVTDADVAAASPGDTLQSAADDGRLYLADYHWMAGVKGGTFPSGRKYAYAPKVVFVLPSASRDGRLRPLVIQLGQDAAVFETVRPQSQDWADAKRLVIAADTNVHELVSHLGWTHLTVEPFAVATHRNLPPDHPVYRLIAPHVEGTIFINNSAQSTLITAGHQVDAALAGTIDESRGVTVKALTDGFAYNDHAPPDRLAARGVLDPRLSYPYRDDALALWALLHDWTTAYIEAFYADDAALLADDALASWAADLTAEEGGRLPGFGDDGDGVVRTRAYLAKALAQLLFTASAQHAAVNFAQKLLMAYAPSTPGALYGQVPRAAGTTSLDLIADLPGAALQMEFLSLLGGVYHTRLGRYDRRAFDDRVKGAVQTLQQGLDALDAKIAAEAPGRPFTYDLLRPSLVPQSINI